MREIAIYKTLVPVIFFNPIAEKKCFFSEK